MRFVVLTGLGLLISGCFSAEPQGVKTPDEIVAEQEAIVREALQLPKSEDVELATRAAGPPTS